MAELHKLYLVAKSPNKHVNNDYGSQIIKIEHVLLGTKMIKLLQVIKYYFKKLSWTLKSLCLNLNCVTGRLTAAVPGEGI